MLFTVRQYHCLLCLLLLQSLAIARAQQALRVVIEESHTTQRVGEVDLQTTSAAWTRIGAERFRDRDISLPQLLKQEAGVQTRSSGGAGSYATVVLRGASSEQVRVYLDGVPLNDASGGAVDLNMISLDMVERIDIYRGTTPLQLGQPSIGGAVNIITRRQREKPTHRLKASIASFNTAKLNLASSLKHADDELLFSASVLRSDNDFIYRDDNGTPFNPDDDSEQRRQNDGVQHLNALANWKHALNRQLDAELRLSLSARDKQIPSVSNSAAVRTRLDTRQYDLLTQLHWRQFLRRNSNANIRLSTSYKKEVFDDTLAQLGFINQYSLSQTRKQGVQFYNELFGQASQWKWLAGVSRESYDTQNSLAPVPADTNLRRRAELSLEHLAFFDEASWVFSSMLRAQQIEDSIATQSDAFGNSVAGFDKLYRLLNWQLGIKYRLDRQSAFSANLGSYVRAPSFVELFGGSGLLLGNAGLQQESALNRDLGLHYQWYRPGHWLHDAELTLGVFDNRIEDLIVYLYNGQGVGVPENISDATLRGLEFSLKLHPQTAHSVFVEASYTDSINRSRIGSFNGKQLPSYYRNSLGLRYRYQQGTWSLGVEAEFKRNMFHDRSNLLPGDAVNRLNLDWRRNWPEASLELRLDNLLDESIRYYRNRPTPGRRFSLSYSQAF